MRGVIEPLLLGGQIATRGIVAFELLYSAPSPATYHDLAEVLRAMPRVPVTDGIVDRALEVQPLLASTSQPRSVPLPDLLVAACSEAAGLTVLRYHSDYEHIAKPRQF
ncbi:MAG: PIN domain-containing protein [Acidimicrobiales bacterium]